MTISEIRDYLAKYCGEGYGDAPILACDKRDNPLTDANCVASVLFIESNDGERYVVLQTG